MAERLHVGVDGRELFGKPTGVGRYLAEILRQWGADASWPHRLTIFAATSPTANLRALHPGASWQVEDDRRAGTWWEQTRLPRAARRAGLDVLFAPAYTAPLRSPCPFVVAIHDLSFFAHPEWFAPREGWRRRWLTRRAATRASAVITLSEFSAHELVHWTGVDRARVSLAPPGVPARIATARKRPSRSVLYVGSLFNRRHISELIESFVEVVRRVPDAHLQLVGDNRTYPRLDPATLARDRGIASSVHWSAYATDAELSAFYADAGAFVFLSDYEGFGMTPFEAMAHGVPVVMLDTPVAREIQGPAASLVTLDPAAIATAIVRLLEDADARAALVSAGDERLTHFSWSRSAGIVRDALTRAAATGR